MQLRSINQFIMAKHAHFVPSESPQLAAHANSNLLAFSTRQHQVILHNLKTGRSKAIWKGQQQINAILFTQMHLLVVEKGCHEILAFSLESEKLKKKITGHRSQVGKLVYSEHRKVFASMCHDVCIIWNEPTLTKQKTLKCSTSEFIDCKFAENGSYFFTAFKDATMFVWNLENYQYRQCAFDFRVNGICVNYSSYVGVYGKNTVQMADLSQQILKFNDIDVFWDEAIPIKNVGFLSDHLVLQCGSQLYIAQIMNQHRVHVKKVKAISNPISVFFVGGCGSVLGILDKQQRTISLMEGCIQRDGTLVKIGNPLTNEGLYCGGGYGNSQGCFLDNGSLQTYAYEDNLLQLEPLTIGTYSMNSPLFSLEKLQSFVRKSHILPQKHRALAYRYLLNLPINAKSFKKYEALGRHECVETLETKYPLKNRQLAESFKDIMSSLAHYSPVFSEAENVPSIVFPIVCLFGNDRFLCFEVLYRLFTNWLNFLFKNFPAANTDYIQNMQQLMQSIDIQILNHLKSKKLSFTKLCWSLISSLFSTVFPRQTFLSILDCLFTHPNSPELLMFLTLGYIVYTRATILHFSNQSDLQTFISNQHTVNTGKYMKIFTKLHENYKKKVRYNFKQVDLSYKDYIQYGGYPKEAVRMYEGRRKLQTEEYRKAMDARRYKEEIDQEMGKMALEIRRQAQKEVIEAQAYLYHSENQVNNKISLPNDNKALRIQRLGNLIEQLKQAMSANQEKKEKLRGFIPSINCDFEGKKDSQLEEVQANLMDLLSRFKPINFQKPLHSQPLPMRKYHVDDHKGFKAASSAQAANKVWQINKLGVKNQEQSWSNDVLKSMKV